MRVAVLGAGGIIAPAILCDLAETEEFEDLTLLDLDGTAARRAAEQYGGGKATGAAVDALDRQGLTLALEGHQVLINAANHRVNLAAMDAALAAGCNYIDLGGLYHVTKQQLAMAPAFESAGLVAVLGCGAGPGKTNLMAVVGARALGDEPVAIRCASAGYDEKPPEGLAIPYALDALLDELTIAPVAVRAGERVELEPLQAGGDIDFPKPIGRQPTVFALHSEVVTLPDTIGATECDFRLALAPGVEAHLRDVAGGGVGATATVRPSAQTWSAQHVEVTSATGASVTVTAVTRPHVRWGLGGAIVSTGTVASSVTRLIARGALGPLMGVFAPEQAIDPDVLFAELEPRGCTVEVTAKPLETAS